MERLTENIHRLISPYIWPFFAVYPYNGNIRIGRADARGAISRRDRFFYNRIPKVANSTVIKTLAVHSAQRRGVHHHGNGKSYFTRPAFANHALAREIKRNYFKFTFVRNPFTRVLSAYLDKVVRERHRRYQKWALKKGVLGDPTFADFCHYLDDVGIYEDPHWAPQVDCLLIPADEFDFIGRFERLDADLRVVLERVFPGQPFSIVNSSPPRTNANAKLREHYSQTERDIVRRLYAEDLRVFGYGEHIETLFAAPSALRSE